MIKANEKIKLLVIGDSISSGYNSAYGYDISGSGKIINDSFTFDGLSYSSFFCDYVEKIQKNKMEWFENFAMQGTRIEDWLYFYGVNEKKYNYENSKDILRIVQKIDKNKKRHNIFHNRSKKQFNDFKNFSDFKLLKQKTKEANLIFLTLGANDLFHFITVKEIKILNNKNLLQEEKFNEYKKWLNKFIEKIFKQINLLIKKIFLINENVKIVFLSYPLTFLKIRKLFFAIKKENSQKNKWENYFDNKVQIFQKNITQIYKNVNFVDICDKEFWIKNANLLSKYFYEIHPSTIGYKKIAKNLFYKITFGNEENFKNAVKVISSFEENSYINNLKDYKKIIEFNLSNKKIIKKLKWDTENESDLLVENKIEKIYSVIESKGNFSNFYYTIYNSINQHFKNIFEIYEEKTNIKFREIQNEMHEILINDGNKYSFTNFILKNEWANNNIKEIDEKITFSNIDSGFVLQPFYNTIKILQLLSSYLTDSNKIYNLLQLLNSFGFFKYNFNRFVQLIESYSNIIVNKNVASYIAYNIIKNINNYLHKNKKNNISKYLDKINIEYIKNILNKITNKEDIKNFFKDIFFTLLNISLNIDKYKNLSKANKIFTKKIYDKHLKTIINLINFLYENDDNLGKAIMCFILDKFSLKIDIEKRYLFLKNNLKNILKTSIGHVFIKNLILHFSMHPILPFSKRNSMIFLENLNNFSFRDLKELVNLINLINVNNYEDEYIADLINEIFDKANNEFILFKILKNPETINYVLLGIKFNILNIGKGVYLRKVFFDSLIPLFNKLFNLYNLLNQKNKAIKSIYRLFILIQTIFYLSIKNSNLYFSNVAFLNENNQMIKFFTSKFPKHKKIIEKILCSKYKINNLNKDKFSKNDVLPLIYFMFEKNPNEKKFYNYEILIRFFKLGIKTKS